MSMDIPEPGRGGGGGLARERGGSGLDRAARVGMQNFSRKIYFFNFVSLLITLLYVNIYNILKVKF